MKYYSVDRADLVRMLSGQSYSPPLLADGDITIGVTMRDRRIVVPQTIFVKQLRTEEFLAWANTYLPLQQPLSSLAHVLPHSLLGWFKSALEREDSESVLPLAGALVARELFASSHPAYGPGIEVSVALATVLLLRLDAPWRAQVVDRWRRVRAMTGAHDEFAERLAREEMDSFWSVAFAYFGADGSTSETRLLDAMRELSKGGALSSSRASKILGTSIDISGIENQRSARDEKLPLVNSLMEGLREIPASAAQRSFMAGYAMTRLAIGSVEYAGLLAKQDVPSSAALWYGLLSLIGTEPMAGPSAGLIQAMAHRLLRAQDVQGFPTCHSSFEEMEILSRAGGARGGTIAPHEARVELAPFVTTVFARHDADRLRSREMNESHSEVVRMLRRSIDLLEGSSGPRSAKRPRRGE